ncbi:hypothetical protein AX17_000030 [Amanita inopinata Kibby_2008]|nr:hypothetical protein AX17_000030 [Amanita inopinata Kibby_2008]
MPPRRAQSQFSPSPSRAPTPPTKGEDEGPFFDLVDELQQHGINMQDILKLKAAAIHTVSGVNMTTRRQMLKIKGMSEAKVEKIKEAAHRILGCPIVDFHVHNNKMMFNCRDLHLPQDLSRRDAGWWNYVAITDRRTGKTQLAHTMSVVAQLPPELGGASGKVAYIDAEGTFRPERIKSIAERFDVDGNMALENILYARAFNSEHQMELINECSLRFAEDKDFRLLIVDSIMALFRVDFSGRGELSERQQKLAQMLSKLVKLSEEYNIVVLLTNQVQSDPGATMTFVAGGALKPIGGHILSHASATRMFLRKGRAEERVAKLVDSPERPESEASYRLDEGGWADYLVSALNVLMMITLDLDASNPDAHTRRTLADISLSVAKCKKIVVVTGAGISCSCGIPDFRSSDGLYALVKQQYPDIVLKGRDLFEASLFRDPKSTAVFYTFISQLKQSIDAASPSPTHCFIKALDTKKKLLRSYTQNIDGLEEQAGLLGSSSQGAKTDGKRKSKINTKDVRNVQLHGDIHCVRCMTCSAEFPCTQEHLKHFNEGMSPACPECLVRFNERAARSARPIKVGSLRPAIVLYGEPHPLGDEIGNIQMMDIARKPDMLIIMGTSLKVHGLKKLVKDFARTVHGSIPSAGPSDLPRSKRWAGKVVFVNKTPPAAEWSNIIDYHIAGETDAWSTKVINDWKRMRPADWEIQQTLVASDGDVGTNGTLKHVKKVSSGTTKSKTKCKFTATGNRCPSSMDMILSTPIAAKKPSSPGKRRQLVEHYSDLEASPSKKRTYSKRTPLAESERKLLFAETTNLHE